MFEKEAEEHCNEAICSKCGIPPEGEVTCCAKCHNWQDEYDAFKDGITAGYDKAKGEIKELLKTLIVNCPDTYSGTDAALSQKRMFRFQDARNKIELFLKEEI